MTLFADICSQKLQNIENEDRYEARANAHERVKNSHGF